MSIKNTSVITILFLAILALSCKKNDDSTDLSSSMLIKRMQYTDSTGQHYGTLKIFEYDSSGRVSQELYYRPGWMDSTYHKFKYYPSMVIMETFYLNIYKTNRTTFYLNSNGLAVADTQVNYDDYGDSTITFTDTYIYDQNGYMIERKMLISGDTSNWISENYQILNGNVVSTVYDRADWVNPLTISFEYYPNTVNTLGNANTGMLFLGKSSTNLVKSALTQWSYPKTAVYTYSLDARNRVVREFVRGDGYYISTQNLLCTYY